MTWDFEPFLTQLITPRLILRCLHPIHLRLLIEAPARFEELAGFFITRQALTPIVWQAINKKLRKMETAAKPDYPWFSYWLIWIRDTRFGAGLIGFKGIPPTPADVEIGYGIDPAYQSRGYTTEAVRTLSAWAFNDPRCTGIFANVLKTNPASSKVLEKAGFNQISTSLDAIFWRLPRPA